MSSVKLLFSAANKSLIKKAIPGSYVAKKNYSDWAPQEKETHTGQVRFLDG